MTTAINSFNFSHFLPYIHPPKTKYPEIYFDNSLHSLPSSKAVAEVTPLIILMKTSLETDNFLKTLEAFLSCRGE